MEQPNQNVIPVEEQFKMMADMAPAMIWISGIDKLCYFFNTGWLRFSGRTEKEEYGTGWMQGIHPEDLERCMKIYTNSFDRREEFKMEYRLKRYDGKYRWLLDSGVPRYASDGSFAGYIGTCVDIDELLTTERLKKEYISAGALKKEQYLNEELATTNEELNATNEDLQRSRENLQNLNEKLEERVARRTAALAEREAKLLLAIETGKMGTWSINPATYQVQMSDYIKELFGFSSVREITIEEILTAVDPDYHQPLNDILKNAIENYQSSDIQYPITNLITKQRKWVRATGKVFFDTHGDLSEYGGMLIDVTEQVEARQTLKESYQELQRVNEELLASNEELTATNEEVAATNEELTETQIHLEKIIKKLEESESRLRMATDSAEIGTWYINPVTKEFIASSRLKQLFGFEPEEEMPYDLAVSQIHPDYQQKVIDGLDHAIRTGETFNMEYPLSGYHDQKTRWVKSVGKRNGDQLQNVQYITGVLHDITEKKLDELRKNDFIGMVSHELKTPLTSLSGYVQMLKKKAVTAEDSFSSSALEKVNTQIRKMTGMINGFLNVSRLESGKIYLEKTFFKLNVLIQEIVEEFRLTVSTHEVKTTFCGDVKVYADQDKIGSVISNLLSNAVKYSPRGKNVTVDCKVTDGRVQISIKDEGMGIKPQFINNLFERYYRVETNHTQHISGFGIGLYLSAEIVKRHDGYIWVESTIGVGSTFFFVLPLAVEDTTEPAQ